MKELIAYSTMSQLGYMITSLSIKLFNLSYFHLIFHAYFKALLFITIGTIIHTIMDNQDIRLSGSLIIFIPLSYIWLIIGLTSLFSLPFTTGFYSKENLILNSFFINNSILYNFIFIIFNLTAFITILYSIKLIKFLFFNKTNLSIFILKNLHFFSYSIIFSLSLLSFFSFFLGFFLIKFSLFLNINIPFLSNFYPLILKFLPFFFFLFSYFLFFSSFFVFFPSSSSSFHSSFLFIKIGFGINAIMTYITGIFLILSYRILYKIFDYGIFNLIFIQFHSHYLSFSSFISSTLNPLYLFHLFFLSFFFIFSIF